MRKKSISSIEAKPPKPDIFRYHDYRVFLKDWTVYLRKIQPQTSLRWLAAQAGLSTGYLPPILSGGREISFKALIKLLPHLSLQSSERAYLESLVKLRTADSQEARQDALQRMNKFTSYQRRNPNEAVLIEYMSHWHYIAIREMAALPNFKTEPDWIQSKLKVHVPLAEIHQALEFLTKNGYLEVSPDGTVRPLKEQLEYAGGVYRTALTEYHRQMFSLATQSIDNTPADARDLVGHTVLLDNNNFNVAREILQEAIAKIQGLGGGITKSGDAVYHMELALFPLTEKEGN